MATDLELQAEVRDVLDSVRMAPNAHIADLIRTAYQMGYQDAVEYGKDEN